MSDEEHVRRPKLERSEPIRSFSTLVGGGRGAASPAPASPSIGDAFSRAVEVGYRVIDEYIQQGQQAAARMRKGEYGAEAATADFQDLAVRMTRSASDLMEAWLQLVAGATGVGGGAATSGPAPFGPAPANGRGPEAGARWTDAPLGTSPPVETRAAGAAAPSDAGDLRLRIEVRASCPTEVSVDLRGGASHRPLRVHALRSLDADQPRLEATLSRGASDEEPSVLRVDVPPGHPPGAYHGLILDEELNRPLGTLTVHVLSVVDEATR